MFSSSIDEAFYPIQVNISMLTKTEVNRFVKPSIFYNTLTPNYCLINITYVHRDMDLVGHVIEIPCKVRSNHIYKPINFLTLLYVITFTKSKLFRIFNPSDKLYLVLWLLSSQDQLMAFWPSSFLGSGIKSWNSLQSSSCVHPLLCGW